MRHIKLSIMFSIIAWGVQLGAAAQQAQLKSNQGELWRVHFFVDKKAVQELTGETLPKLVRVDKVWRSKLISVPRWFSCAQVSDAFKIFARDRSGRQVSAKDYGIYPTHPQKDDVPEGILGVSPSWATQVKDVTQVEPSWEELGGRLAPVRSVSICTAQEMKEKEENYRKCRQKILYRCKRIASIKAIR